MPDRPATRFVYHATWVVEVPNHPKGKRATVAQLDPIGPGQMGRVIHLTSKRLLQQFYGRDVGIVVGAVSVMSDREREPVRWEAQTE